VALNLSKCPFPLMTSFTPVAKQFNTILSVHNHRYLSLCESVCFFFWTTSKILQISRCFQLQNIQAKPRSNYKFINFACILLVQKRRKQREVNKKRKQNTEPHTRLCVAKEKISHASCWREHKNTKVGFRFNIPALLDLTNNPCWYDTFE